MNIVFKHIINDNLLIIISLLISLTFFGCDKTVSIKQIQNKQENTATDDRIQSQPIQENTSPKDEQSADSTDNSMPVEPSLDNTTKLQHGDVTKCPQQESQGQFDQPNTEDSSSPSEAVLVEDKNNQPPEQNSASDNIKDNSSDIAAATQAIYNSLIALQPEFQNCYSKFLKKFDSRLWLEDNTYIYSSLLDYNIEYDEYGTIYYKEGLADRELKPTAPDQFLDQCIYSVLPKSFDIDLSHHVSSFSDGVQKFGRLKLVLQTDPRLKTLSVYIEPKYSFSIGTEHPMVNNKDKADWTRFGKHYTRWLSRRVVQKSRE